MTRVLHLLAPGREGGLERVVSMLALGQTRGSAEAHVAAVLSPGDAAHHPFVENLRRLGVAVTTIVVSGRGYVDEYRSVTRIIADWSPTVVHTHGYRSDVVAGIAAHRAGIATVSTVHGFTGGGRRNRLNERIQCFALRYADAVVAVSRPLVDRLTRAGVSRDRIHFVANGYRQEGNSLSRDEARRRLGIAPDAVVAGWVGRLSAEKGPDVMIEALAATDHPWRLSMLGDGRDNAQVRERAEALHIADRITWHGSVPNAASLFGAFDAFVLSSRTEGTPIALFEAMAAGVPIVATRVGGVPDVVDDAEALLVPSEDPAAIAQALAAVRNQPASAMGRCQAARERLEAGFAFNGWIDAMQKVYEAACARVARRVSRI